MSAHGAAAPAYEMRGPSAFAGGWSRFFHLARMLAVADFKTRFFGSALGYLWTLIRPLALFGVLYAVFSTVFSVTDDVAHYPLLLLSGMVLFWFVSETTGSAVTSLIDNENLVRKVQFPRVAVPLSVVLTGLLNLGMNLIAVFVFIAASGIEVRLTWLEIPVLIGMLVVFSLGLSMILSALYVFARDVEPIWSVVLQAAFYATPVLYPIELLSKENSTLAHIAMINPVATVIQQFRYAVIDPNAESAGEALGGQVEVLIPIAVTVGVFLFGVWIYDRLAPRIAEEL
jgi:ABC-2 type transport system permease protein